MQELEDLTSTITYNYTCYFVNENAERKAKILSEEDAIYRLIFFSMLAVFGITFAVAAATTINGYLITVVAAIIGIVIGTVLGPHIGLFILDKIPDFKSCTVVINSNKKVIIENRPKNKYIARYLKW